MAAFGVDQERWEASLHDDIVMETPYGPTNVYPARVQGRKAAAKSFRLVADVMKVRFHDVRASPMRDPARVVVEYKGQSKVRPGMKQDYIAIQEYRDGKIILFREFWNTLVTDREFGDTKL